MMEIAGMICLIMGLTASPSFLCAQDPELMKVTSDPNHRTGALPIFFDKDSAKGSPYLVYGWLHGVVELNDHRRLPEKGRGLFFNFDKMYERLYVTDGIGKVWSYPNDSVSSFALGDGDIVYNFEKIPWVSQTHFFQPMVRSQTGYSLYKRLITRIVAADYKSEGYYTTGSRSDQYVDHYVYYVLYPGNRSFKTLLLNKREIKKTFGTESAALNKFFSQNGQEINESTVVDLVHFLNEEHGYTGMAVSTMPVAQPGYRLLRLSSPHNCFPDTARDQGHVDGDGINQPRAGHYDDSSVLLVIPKGLRAEKRVDLVFWFHGWHNNIDTALQFYGLAGQFAASGRNAVLVLPEAAKNAADSYGGKMGRTGMFKSLVEDIVAGLTRDGAIPPGVAAGNIVLAGHSGAYVVIADILDKGEQDVQEVFLFDALYARMNSFMNWVQKKDNHFVHWFTNTGYGPDKMSDTMMLHLRQAQIPYALNEEGAISAAILAANRILFVHSPRQHNDIINKPDDFALLLGNSYFLRAIKE
jgi:hypothetical protein